MKLIYYIKSKDQDEITQDEASLLALAAHNLSPEELNLIIKAIDDKKEVALANLAQEGEDYEDPHSQGAVSAAAQEEDEHKIYFAIIDQVLQDRKMANKRGEKIGSKGDDSEGSSVAQQLSALLRDDKEFRRRDQESVSTRAAPASSQPAAAVRQIRIPSRFSLQFAKNQTRI